MLAVSLQAVVQGDEFRIRILEPRSIGITHDHVDQHRTLPTRSAPRPSCATRASRRKPPDPTCPAWSPNSSTDNPTGESAQQLIHVVSTDPHLLVMRSDQ